MDVKEWLGENNKLGFDIWSQKYQYENESFDNWLDRISNKDKNLRQKIVERKFLFGGRILSNRGLQKLGKKITYSNCFNLGEPEDTIESIFQKGQQMARTYSAGGGCGINLGKLRPRGSVVHNNAKFSTGVVPFMDMYSKITETIGQDARRGALIIILPSNHPDIEEFINCKNDLTKVLKANISIMVDDDFMIAVSENNDYKLKFFVEQTGELIEKTIHAKDLFRQLAENAWNYAEPGILYKGTIDKYNLMSEVPEYKITGSNPCGEIPMPSMSACLLGSINLSEYVFDPYENIPSFDFDGLKQDIFIYVKALNECLHENLEFMPLKEQKEAVEKYKAIGLGYFGFADMLIKMNMRYGGSASLWLANEIGQIVATAAIIASDQLCNTYDTPEIIEQNMKEIMQSQFYKNHIEDDGFDRIIPINTSLLTCAPTGSLSTMLGVSGGIEPIFSLTTWRKTQSLNGGEETSYEVDLPVFEEWKKINEVTETPDWIKNSTALNLPINERIEMQSTWQKHIDNAISSTVNLSEETTVDEIEYLFMNAWSSGLKGITVYRTGCSRGAILTEKKDDKKETPVPEPEFQLKWGDTISSADNLIGLKRKIMSGCGSLHIKAFYDWGGNLREVFFSKGSDGGCNAFMVGLSRMASLAARSGASTEKIVDQLRSVPACPAYVARTATKGDTSKGKNCPSAIGIVLVEMQNEMDSILTRNGNHEEQKFSASDLMESKEIIKEMNSGKTEQQCIDENICPKCYIKGNIVNLVAGGGCYTCDQCGFTKCD